MSFERTSVYLPAAMVTTVKLIAKRHRKPVARMLRELVDTGLRRVHAERFPEGANP